VEDDGVGGGTAPSAERLRPRDAGPTVVVEGRLPLLAVLEVGGLVVGVGRQVAPRPVAVGAGLQGGVLGQERPRLGSERSILSGVVEVHGPLTVENPETGAPGGAPGPKKNPKSGRRGATRRGRPPSGPSSVGASCRATWRSPG